MRGKGICLKHGRYRYTGEDRCPFCRVRDETTKIFDDFNKAIVRLGKALRKRWE